MTMNKSFLSVLALMLCFGLYSNAQELEILTSAGTEASSSSASISYTVGELVVETGTSSDERACCNVKSALDFDAGRQPSLEQDKDLIPTGD